jgi:hypothetical protein
VGASVGVSVGASEGASVGRTNIGNDRIAQLMDRVTVVALEGDSRRKLTFADAATSPTLPNSSQKLLRGGQGNTGLTTELKRKGKPLKLDV